MSEYLNPDFDSRNKIIQPQTQVYRASYRSPISSKVLNLSTNSIVEDLNYLYSKFDSIHNEFNLKLEDLYKDGGIQISTGIILKTIYDYGTELQCIREEIENLR